MELLDSISEAQIAMNLFLNNKFQMAEDRMATQLDLQSCFLLRRNLSFIDE